MPKHAAQKLTKFRTRETENPMSTLEVLLSKLKNKEAVIGIAGLGYVGLPLMLRYADVGCKVIGIDIDIAKVDLLNAGKSYIEHISSDLVASAFKSGWVLFQTILI